MRTPINNIGIFDDIPAPRYTNKKERSMTELTPLALKLRTVYINSEATGDALWNEMAGVVEAELAAPRPARLPTVEECHQELADRYAREGYPTGNYWDWCASVVLDLAEKLNPTWVEVPPDATIPAGTRTRVEHQEYAYRALEWAAEVDKTPQHGDNEHNDFTYGRQPDGKDTDTRADFGYTMASKGRSNGSGA